MVFLTHWMRASQTGTGLNTLADSGKFGFINWGGWLWWPDLNDSRNRETGNGDWRPYLDDSRAWNKWWAAMTTWSWPGVMQTGPVLKMQMKVTVKTFQWVLCLTSAKELCAGDTGGGWMYCQRWPYVCGRQAVMCNQVVGKGVMDELHCLLTVGDSMTCIFLMVDKSVETEPLLTFNLWLAGWNEPGFLEVADAAVMLGPHSTEWL